MARRSSYSRSGRVGNRFRRVDRRRRSSYSRSGRVGNRFRRVDRKRAQAKKKDKSKDIMIKNLLEKITVVNCADRNRWSEIKTKAINTRYQIVWDASSGLDIYPMVAAKALGKVPDFLSRQLQNAILVMSDYDPDHLNSLKNVYKKLDHGPVRVWRSAADSAESPFYCDEDIDRRHFVGNGGAFIDQMIPLKLWGDDERNNFQETYETRLLSSIHSAHHDLAVPDDDWHLVYFLGNKVYPAFLVTHSPIIGCKNAYKYIDSDGLKSLFCVTIALSGLFISLVGLFVADLLYSL